VYNGAALRAPVTLDLIERTLGLKAIEVDDPNVTVDFEVITGADLTSLGE